MPFEMKPLPCDPSGVRGMSERLIISHYENNDGGAVKRLNLIEEKLAEIDPNNAPGFLINGLKREELIAMNSMILHELFFAGLGEQSEPGAALRAGLARDFGSYERWRTEFIAMGKALGGGSGWVLLSWSPRDRKLVNQWAADHCHTLAGGTPILALDMYEHSYHIDYGAKAATYVDAFMDAIRWKSADRRFLECSNDALAAGRLADQGGMNMKMHGLLSLVTLATVLAFAGSVGAQDIDWKKVDAALGKAGAVQGSVHRYGLPRSDLRVTVDGVAIKPALALGGWVAFEPVHGGAMVMGDLVLTETEIKPVMTKLLEGGVEITALHNHLLRADPPTYYMHVGGHGDPLKMAETIRSALGASKTPFEAGQAAAPPAANVDLPTGQLDEIMRAKGQANGGVYQFGIPRKEPIAEGGMAVPGAMGSANAINFQPTGGGKAAITGDFVVTGEEVNPLIHALRANGIEVTAIHSHMLDEQPRVFFVHFWANDDAVKLAKGIRAALDKTAVAKG